MNAPQESLKVRAATPVTGNSAVGSPSMLPFANLPNSMVGFAHMQAMGMRMFLTQQQELLGFLGRRCEQDLRLLNDIVAAKEPQAMMDVLTDFYRSAAKDYADEMGRSVESAPRAAAAAGEATLEMAKVFAEPKAA